MLNLSITVNLQYNRNVWLKCISTYSTYNIQKKSNHLKVLSHNCHKERQSFNLGNAVQYHLTDKPANVNLLLIALPSHFCSRSSEAHFFLNMRRAQTLRKYFACGFPILPPISWAHSRELNDFKWPPPLFSLAAS